MSNFVEFKAPKPFGTEHNILEVVGRSEKGLTINGIFLKINEHRMKDLSNRTKDITKGSLFGSLARLKGKFFLKKVLIENEDGDSDLGYEITAQGERALRVIKAQVQKAINGYSDSGLIPT